MCEITKVQTIKELFLQEVTIKIPPYQRAYSWEIKQWKQFLGDLYAQKVEKPYHLGQFIFESTNRIHFFVVDGQQRLLTTVLFFAAIAKLDKSVNEINQYLTNKMHAIEEDEQIFSLIKKGEFIDPKEKRLTKSQRNMVEASIYFEKELRKIDEKKINNFENIVNNAVIGIFIVNSKLEATQVFEYQNSRGIKATEFELVKAFLMHQVYLKSANEKSANENIITIQKTVIEIYRSIEAVNGYFSEDHLLERFCWLKYDCDGTLEAIKRITTGIDESEEDSSGFEQETFTLQIKSIKDIIEFFNSFREVCYAVDEIVKQNTCKVIANLFFLSTDLYWDYPLITLWIKNKKLVTNEYLKLLELACMLIMLIRLDSKKNKKDYLWVLASQFYRNEITVDKLFELLKNWINKGECPDGKKWSPINKLFNYYKDYKSEHYYYYEVTKYILWQYEIHLRGDDLQKLLNKKEYAKYTIEHILAKKSNDKENTDAFQERCMNCIGNLSLLSIQDNASISNNSVAEKKLKYKELVDKKIFIHYKEIITEIEWRQKEVFKRRDNIFNFIDSYFRI